MFRKLGLVLLLACGSLGGCAQLAGERPTPPMSEVIAAAQADRTNEKQRLLIIETLMKSTVYVIPNGGSPDPASMTLMEFPAHESQFIPVFSDRATFDVQAQGTGYENKAVPLEPAQFAALLKGDETVVVNPGDRPALEFRASEIKALVRSHSATATQ